MRAPLRLLIADREATRAGIRIALGDAVDVCAEVGDCTEAIRAASQEQPDLCLVGAEVGGNGLGWVRGLARAAPRAAVVVLAPDADVDDLLDALRAGAVGY
ncbi:MAG: response regulator, partial [Solirubrobacteraceae bacterium]